MIVLTETAAAEVKRIMSEEGVENVVLRLAIKGNGCSGFTWKLELDPETTERDQVFEQHGVRIAVDNRSAMYAEGTTVDFYNDLNKRGFVCSNPSVKSTCGCGSSFSI